MTVFNRRPVQLTVETLDPRPSENVLELGFGSGFGLALLSSRVGEGCVCGIDRSSEMVAQARRRNRTAIAAGRMNIIQGSFSHLAWRDSTFDAVLLANVIYFFDAAGTDMMEVHRVLRPGGRVAIYATDRSSMQNWPFCEPETHRIFDRSEIEALLIQGGFARDDIQITSCRFALGIKGIIALARKSAP
jgi:ubiquinone/menaquinone biosynthesis C-methylase UbiE